MSAKLIKQEFMDDEVKYPVLRKHVDHGALVLFVTPTKGSCIRDENEVMSLGFYNKLIHSESDIWERVNATLEISG